MTEIYTAKVLKNQSSAKWGETLTSITECLTHSLIKQGETAETAQEKAMQLTADLGNYLGGTTFYLPMGKTIQIALRNARIYKDFTGDNVQALIKKYHLSQTQIYDILRQQRKLQKTS